MVPVFDSMVSAASIDSLGREDFLKIYDLNQGIDAYPSAIRL